MTRKSVFRTWDEAAAVPRFWTLTSVSLRLVWDLPFVLRKISSRPTTR
jgi:hypothetical protein